MFTLSEIEEFFERQYSQKQIKVALDLLGVTPNEHGQFESSVTEALEVAFGASSDAVRQLPQATVQETQELAIQLASSRAIELNINENALTEIVELVVSKGIAKAVFLDELEQQVLNKVSADLSSERLQSLSEGSAKTLVAFSNILGNPNHLDEIIQKYGGSSEAEVAERQQKLTAETDFDPDAFLAEVSGEVEGEKKPTTIQVTSIKDVQKLASSLLKRYRKPSTDLKTAVS
jgi:hypothetical protein